MEISLSNAGFASIVSHKAMHNLSDDSHNEPPPIPSELYSDYTDAVFSNCTRCGESLKDFPGGFQISKAWKRGECVFEYALCDHCRTQLMEEFSEESKTRLAQFEKEHVSFEGGLEKCSVCGTERHAHNASEFVLTGVCEGDKLLHGLMVCGKCGEKTQELISTHTRDTWRRFRDENFDGPPDPSTVPEIEDIVFHSKPNVPFPAKM